MVASSSVGLLGLGAIGEIYCEHLLGAFPELCAFDLDADKLSRCGARAAGSARELGASCDLVVVSLPDPAAVRAALAGPDGLLEGASPGAVVLDTSTVSPATSRAMHALAAERGIGYLDAPVSGGEPFATGVDGARAASMTFMVGGDAAAFERARPAMEVLGSRFFHLGPSGSGSTVKLISNLCSGIHALVAGRPSLSGPRAASRPTGWSRSSSTPTPRASS